MTSEISDEEVQLLFNHLMNNKYALPVVMDQRTLERLCDRAVRVLTEEPVFLKIKPPVIVVGDIHGQFHDLMKLFQTF